MNFNFRRLAACAITLTIAHAIVFKPSAAVASIIATTDAAHVFAPPSSVNLNAWESNKYIHVFHEKSGVKLQQTLNVDILATGLFQAVSQITPGFLAAGTTVDSYLMHQDGNKPGRLILRGSVTFDQDILAVIVNRTRLDQSDGAVGLATTAYPTHANLSRGLDFGDNLDWVKISPNRRTISFKMVTSSPMDQIRVLTAMPTVPSPGSAALLLCAAFTVAGRRRRQVA